MVICWVCCVRKREVLKMIFSCLINVIGCVEVLFMEMGNIGCEIVYGFFGFFVSGIKIVFIFIIYNI